MPSIELNKMSTTETASDDPIDYASLVIYISSKHPSDAASKCVSLASPYNEIAVVDVASIARPPFVRGVPTVLDTKNQEIFTGTRAISKVQTWVNSQMDSYPTTSERGCSLDLPPPEEASDEPPPQRSLEDLLRKRS